MTQLTEADIDLATKAYGAARTAVQNCHAQINAYADLDENRPDDFDVEEYLQDMAVQLANQSRIAIDAVRVLLELLNLSETRIKFDAMVAEFDDADFTAVGYFDEYLGPNNVVVDALNRCINNIAPLLATPDDVMAQQEVLARMLRQTAHYLDAVGVVPTREKDIQDTLLPALRLAFPDVIRETPIAKQTKTYHPDFSMDSISTAVEVKFAADRQKAKLAMGELYEDMKGYTASEFTHFFGVIYMTGAYLSRDQMEAELKKVKTPKNWSVIPVFGDSKSKSKSKSKVGFGEPLGSKSA